jgi:predicted TIM-barrel fold metal-dependent hydrolase
VFDRGLTQAAAPELMRLSPHFREAFDASRGYNHSPTADVLFEAGERRIADMDANGITMQVLSRGGAQQAPADVAFDLCHAANDTLADTVAAHRGRFAGFAALPTDFPTPPHTSWTAASTNSDSSGRW